MKHLIVIALLSMAAFAEPIGKQYTVGTLQVLEVSDSEEFTVYVRSTDCRANGITVTAVTPTSRASKSAQFIGCGSIPVKFTFKAEGIVQEVRFHVLTGLESYSSVWPR